MLLERWLGVMIALAAGSIAIGGCTTSTPSKVAAPVARPGWIFDTTTACGTTNPFAKPGETIRWYGTCHGGKLGGYGTLIWYQSGRETERNEGTFKDGELDGRVITVFAVGHVIVGDYRAGQREGEFYLVSPDGRYHRNLYRGGELVDKRETSREAFRQWYARQPNTRAMAAVDGALARISQPVEAAPVTPRPAAQPKRRWLTAEEFHRAGVPGARKRVPRSAPNYQLRSILGDKYPLPGAAPASPPWIALSPYRPIMHISPRRSLGAQVTQPTPRHAVGVTPEALPQAPLGYRPIRETARRWRIETLVVSNEQDGARNKAQSIQLKPLSMRQSPRVAAQPAPTVLPAGRQAMADTVFAEGFRHERAGNFARARRAYERLLIEFPSAPATVLANDRLRGLNQARAVPRDRSATDIAGRDVIRVNGHRPVRSRRAIPEPDVRRGKTLPISAAISRRVCTDRKLYENDSAWCGIVIRDVASSYWVEVREVKLRGFGTFGIRRSTCSGDTLLTWFSRGSTVRVPKACMVFADGSGVTPRS